MIKFKEHDGLLFKMLDKPVPLTPNAEMPCLVRFRMPFLERFKGKHEGVAFFCDAIKKNPLYGNRLYAYETRRVGCIAEPRELEIIGYPVADGSKDWALYQMMQGKVIINHNRTIQFMLIGGRVARIGDIASWDSGHWLRIFDDTTGWEIYEPCESPEPQSEPQTDLSVSDEPQAVNPYEVRVSITLEGTVRAGINESCFELSTPNGGWATIGKDQIKDSDLKLVESLLKAQEEKHND